MQNMQMMKKMNTQLMTSSPEKKFGVGTGSSAAQSTGKKDQVGLQESPPLNNEVPSTFKKQKSKSSKDVMGKMMSMQKRQHDLLIEQVLRLTKEIGDLNKGQDKIMRESKKIKSA